MTFDSRIFDRIRVKPGQDRRPASGPACEWPGCGAPATHRAPKGRLQEGQQWRYCLDHVREYNQSYNFFAGMSDDAVLKFQKDAITGHRPTWKMGTGKGSRGDPGRFYAEGATDPFGMFHEVGGNAGSAPSEAAEKRTIRNAERKALGVMGLENDASKDDIKTKFKELVKRHHPDANGGDRSTEDRLVEIIQAYNYLKSVGFC
jgi:hypothetical protein